MSRGKPKVVVGVFETKTAAQECVDELIDAGFKRENIGVISRDQEKGHADSNGGGSMWEEGAAVGVATGAGAGALWALGIAAGVLPAIGPVIAGGLLASVLASAAGGAALAGLVGALVGLGIPEEDAKYYDERFKEGKAIVTVRAGNRPADAARIIVRNGGYDRSRAEGLNGEGAATGGTIEVKRERARAHKTPVKQGEVRVRKEVVTEQQTLHVPVEREEVIIERRPARRGARGGSLGTGEEIRIPVRQEKVSIEKEVVVDEEVRVGKRKVLDRQPITTPVRREKVTVEERGRPRVVRR